MPSDDEGWLEEPGPVLQPKKRVEPKPKKSVEPTGKKCVVSAKCRRMRKQFESVQKNKDKMKEMKMASAARRWEEVLDRCEVVRGKRELKRSNRAVENMEKREKEEEEKKKKEEEMKEREEEWVKRWYPRLEEDGDVMEHVQKLGSWFVM